MGFLAGDYFAPAIIAYLIMWGIFLYMEEWWMAWTCFTIAAFSLFTIHRLGGVIPSGVGFWYKTVLNVLFMLLVIPPAFRFLGKGGDEKAETKNSDSFHEFKRAA